MSKPKATRQPAAYYRLPENSIGYLSRALQSLLCRVIANLAEEAKDAPTLSDVKA